MVAVKQFARTAILAILMGEVLLAGCGAPSSAPPDGLRVLAAETFLGDIAQHVAGDRLQVATLLPVGVDPHEYQPTPTGRDQDCASPRC